MTWRALIRHTRESQVVRDLVTGTRTRGFSMATSLPSSRGTGSPIGAGRSLPKRAISFSSGGAQRSPVPSPRGVAKPGGGFEISRFAEREGGTPKVEQKVNMRTKERDESASKRGKRRGTPEEKRAGGPVSGAKEVARRDKKASAEKGSVKSLSISPTGDSAAGDLSPSSALLERSLSQEGSERMISRTGLGSADRDPFSYRISSSSLMVEIETPTEQLRDEGFQDPAVSPEVKAVLPEVDGDLSGVNAVPPEVKAVLLEVKGVQSEVENGAAGSDVQVRTVSANSEELGEAAVSGRSASFFRASKSELSSPGEQAELQAGLRPGLSPALEQDREPQAVPTLAGGLHQNLSRIEAWGEASTADGTLSVLGVELAGGARGGKRGGAVGKDSRDRRGAEAGQADSGV
jgi:hypothetical protein